jgi:hypothetical protein
MNWNRNVGGGGAIDLAMHLNGMDFKTAVELLSQGVKSLASSCQISLSSTFSIFPRCAGRHFDSSTTAIIRIWLSGIFTVKKPME